MPIKRIDRVVVVLSSYWLYDRYNIVLSKPGSVADIIFEIIQNFNLVHIDITIGGVHGGGKFHRIMK
jgi:hypothetical protein